MLVAMVANWQERKSLVLIRKRASWKDSISSAVLLLWRWLKPPDHSVFYLYKATGVSLSSTPLLCPCVSVNGVACVQYCPYPATCSEVHGLNYACTSWFYLIESHWHRIIAIHTSQHNFISDFLSNIPLISFTFPCLSANLTRIDLLINEAKWHNGKSIN